MSLTHSELESRVHATNKRVEAEKSWFSSKAQIWTYEEGRKKMELGRSTDFKLYENKGIEAEKSWVLNEVQIWTYEEGRKKMGLGRSTDLKSYESKSIFAW